MGKLKFYKIRAFVPINFKKQLIWIRLNVNIYITFPLLSYHINQIWQLSHKYSILGSYSLQKMQFHHCEIDNEKNMSCGVLFAVRQCAFQVFCICVTVRLRRNHSSENLFFPPLQTLGTFPKQLIKWKSFIHSILSFLQRFI